MYCLKWTEFKYCDESKLHHKEYRCETCNPSTDQEIFKWSPYYEEWKLSCVSKPCENCESLVWSKQWDNKFAFILRCEKCPPLNSSYVKFKYFDGGWDIDKMKVFNGNRHVWNFSNFNDEYYDYTYLKFICNKCVSN